MLPPDFDDLMRYIENIKIKYERGGLVRLPDGVYAVHPDTRNEMESKSKAEEAIEQYQGKSLSNIVVGYSIGWVGHEEVIRQSETMTGSFFKPTGEFIKPYSYEKLGEIEKIIQEQFSKINLGDLYGTPIESVYDSIPSEIYDRIIKREELDRFVKPLPIVDSSPCTQMIQEGYEAGMVKLLYCPYAADFSDEEIKARNLYSGKKHAGRKTPYKLLDGASSIVPSIELRNIAELIWFCKEENKAENTLKISDNWDILDARSKPTMDEEVWYLPYYMIPVISKRAVKKRDKILYLDRADPSLYHFKMDVVEHSLPFESSGAIFYSGVYGDEVDRFHNDTYFDRNEKGAKEVKRETKVIRTVDLSRELPQINLYQPKKIPSPDIDYSAEIPTWNPNVKTWAILGGGLGALPGLWEGQPWLYLSTVLGAGILSGSIYAYATWLNESEREKLVKKWTKEIEKAEFAQQEEERKRRESIQYVRKNIVNALQTPFDFYNNYSDEDIWSEEVKEFQETPTPSTYCYPALSNISPRDSTAENQCHGANKNETPKQQKKLMSYEIQKGLSGLENAAERNYERLSGFVSKELIGEDFRSDFKKELIQMGGSFKYYFDIRTDSLDKERADGEKVNECYKSHCKEFNGSP